MIHIYTCVELCQMSGRRYSIATETTATNKYLPALHVSIQPHLASLQIFLLLINLL